MAEPLKQEHDGDPWTSAHTDPRPWCDVCEGDHADHVKFLAERAVTVAGWSGTAEALETALKASRTASYQAHDGDKTDGLYKEIARLVAELRQVTDAAAWRSLQEVTQARDEQQAELKAENDAAADLPERPHE